MPKRREQAVGVAVRRGGERLLGLIEGTLDIARIEAGKLSVRGPSRCGCARALRPDRAGCSSCRQLSKGLRFEHDIESANRCWCAPTSGA